MSDATTAWAVVQISEFVRASEELLLRSLRLLDPDATAAMPEDGGWVLSGADGEELRTLLTEHGETAERLRSLAEQIPEHGVAASYSDVRDGAAAALADGILDPTAVTLAARALDVRTGWAALADALASTDVRCGWNGLSARRLLGTFRRADPRLVSRALADADIDPDMFWDELSAEATRRLAATLRSLAERN